MSNTDTLVSAKSEITHPASTPIPIVLSTRVRLARNLDAFPFPGWASDQKRHQILQLCKDATLSITNFKNSYTFDNHQTPDLDKQLLVERHLISPELSSEKSGAGVIISKNQALAVMINEEDHLRIQIIQGGFSIQESWEALNKIDSKLEKSLDFAFSQDLGYLTACPTNLGTGLRASAMLHLPGLVIGGEMEKVIRAANQLGLAVRGLFGEGSDASGSIFQISNQQTLGESEENIIQRLIGVLKTIIEQEQNIRHRLLQQEPEKLLDKVGRAYGILQHARFVSSDEAMNLLSLFRMGIDFNIFPEKHRRTVDRLLIEMQPAHMQVILGQDIPSDQRDALRASMLRQKFKSISKPNYDAIQ